jgi:hypothetical protein
MEATPKTSENGRSINLKSFFNPLNSLKNLVHNMTSLEWSQDSSIYVTYKTANKGTILELPNNT